MYNPHFEAISPTLPPEESKDELSAVRSSKEELLQNIKKVDTEISNIRTQIEKLKGKQVDFNFL